MVIINLPKLIPNKFYRFINIFNYEDNNKLPLFQP